MIGDTGSFHSYCACNFVACMFAVSSCDCAQYTIFAHVVRPRALHDHNQMGMEVLEGLRVSQSQQQPTLQEKQQRDPFPSRYTEKEK